MEAKNYVAVISVAFEDESGYAEAKRYAEYLASAIYKLDIGRIVDTELEDFFEE